MNKNFMDNLFSNFKMNKKTTIEKKSDNIPFSTLTVSPFQILFSNLKDFGYLAFIYAFIISVLAFLSNSSYICGYYSELDLNSFISCSKTAGLYVSFFLIRLLIVSLFLRLWYKKSVCKMPIEVKELFIITIQDLKIFSKIMGVVALLCLPLISFYILYGRIPNPNWKIESLFFLGICIIAFLPIWAMHFWGVISCSITASKQLPYKQILKITNPNMLKIVLSIFIIIMIWVLTIMNFKSLANTLLEQNLYIGILVSDFIYNIICLFFLTLLTANSMCLNSAVLQHSQKE